MWKNDPLFRRLAIASGIYVILCPPVVWLTRDFLHLFLAWNILLALIPTVLMKIVIGGRIRNPWLLGGMLLLWVLFLPNSLYVITDLLYVGDHKLWVSGSFYEPVTYVRNLVGWTALFHLSLGAFLATVSGTYSLHLFARFARKRWGTTATVLTVTGVSVLVGVGIYIGRFYRYNSWDFFNVGAIWSDLWTDFDWFTVGFIGMMTGIQLMALFLLGPLFPKGEER